MDIYLSVDASWKRIISNNNNKIHLNVKFTDNCFFVFQHLVDLRYCTLLRILTIY